MVSFDVKSLFTSVPIDKALDVINRRLTDDDTLGDRSTLTPDQVTMLLRICLKTTYFMYYQQFYEQMEGAAMGSPVSPVVANIFMEFVEKAAIDTSPSPVRFWKRYVDDTFCFLQKRNVDEVLQHHLTNHQVHSEAGEGWPTTFPGCSSAQEGGQKSRDRFV